jgi:hypothetical protein
MFDSTMIGGELEPVSLTLYTDAFVIRGQIRTRQRRLTDILNLAEDPFLVISDTVTDEYGSHGLAVKTDFAQVNLSAVLFAVADNMIEARPDLRTPKVPEMALISIPPFKITGRIHLLPERDLREALSELTGAFVPVTDVTYWSDTVGEARATAPMIAFNHNRAQILAPHTAVDPWSGLDRSGAATESGPAASGGEGPGSGGAAGGDFGRAPGGGDFGRAPGGDEPSGGDQGTGWG